MRVEAWRVHDTGLVAAPGRFRRLPGLVRHHQGDGATWPTRVVLERADDELRVADVDGALVGAWPLADVRARVTSNGPPVSFVLEVPGSSQLLAAPAGPEVDALLSGLDP